MANYTPKLKDWKRGTAQWGIFLRTKLGSVIEGVNDKSTELESTLIGALIAEPDKILSRETKAGLIRDYETHVKKMQAKNEYVTNDRALTPARLPPFSTAKTASEMKRDPPYPPPKHLRPSGTSAQKKGRRPEISPDAQTKSAARLTRRAEAATRAAQKRAEHARVKARAAKRVNDQMDRAVKTRKARERSRRKP